MNYDPCRTQSEEIKAKKAIIEPNYDPCRTQSEEIKTNKPTHDVGSEASRTQSGKLNSSSDDLESLIDPKKFGLILEVNYSSNQETLEDISEVASKPISDSNISKSPKIPVQFSAEEEVLLLPFYDISFE